LKAFGDLKNGRKHRYVILKLNKENTAIQFEKSGDPSKTWDEFKKDLPIDPPECRYALYDFEFDTKDGKRNKILFILWAPEYAPIKAKMLVTSSKGALKQALNSALTEVEAHDNSEIDYQTILDKASRSV